MNLELFSDFKPTGDQPQAIKQLVDGISHNDKFQTLLGVTGSGKTFTMANVIQETQRPTLVLSHNKTLAAQLYGEFQHFFPNNAVEYFVSYYDYYQPEAYLPASNTYIEKDLNINDEIEKMRLSTSSSLLSGRRDIIVVSSVSCIYGIGNPKDFHSNIIEIVKGQSISRNKLLHSFVDSMYSRTEMELNRGSFRVRGDTIDIYPAYADEAFRIQFWGDEIEQITSIDPISGHKIMNYDDIRIFPANIFVTSKDSMKQAIYKIQDDLVKQIEYFKDYGRHLEAKRLEDRVNYDLEMMRELGYCSGIENYSRYFDGREAGTRPFCLMDYFPDDYMLVIDESHVTIPQVRAMYGGDRSRKNNLVEHGFRLPSAMDNRPLKFEEFETLINKAVFMSATPADYELEKSEGVIVEQIIRPTGLIDPPIEIRPSMNQIDDLLNEINIVREKNERVLVTTLTKRMAEELSAYILKLKINCAYIHSDVDTLDRVEIMRDLQLGIYDVLVGVNLLREGLDLPEVSLVAILDADKEGFLRSERALTQTAGRAARNINSKVIMYADKVTNSMQKTIDETNRRRNKQTEYNLKNNITPVQINKTKEEIIQRASVTNKKSENLDYTTPNLGENIAADPVIKYMTTDQLKKTLKNSKKALDASVKELNFIEAARLRDEVIALEKLITESKQK